MPQAAPDCPVPNRRQPLAAPARCAPSRARNTEFVKSGAIKDVGGGVGSIHRSGLRRIGVTERQVSRPELLWDCKGDAVARRQKGHQLPPEKLTTTGLPAGFLHPYAREVIETLSGVQQPVAPQNRS